MASALQKRPHTSTLQTQSLQGNRDVPADSHPTTSQELNQDVASSGHAASAKDTSGVIEAGKEGSVSFTGGVDANIAHSDGSDGALAQVSKEEIEKVMSEAQAGIFTGLPRVREKSGKNKIFSRSGNFEKMSGNFAHLTNVREMSGNFVMTIKFFQK